MNEIRIIEKIDIITTPAMAAIEIIVNFKIKASTFSNTDDTRNTL